MHKPNLAALGACVTLAACVSVQQRPIDATSAAALKDRELTIARRAKPDFAALTPAKAAIGGGLIGAAVMISAGNELIASNGVDDPADRISERLAAALSQRHGVRVSDKSTLLSTDDVAEVTKNNPEAELVLDTRTINWSFVYFPTSWDKYRVIYTARLRLIDVRRGAVLAEGGCRRVPEESAEAPSYDELVADNARRLKHELALAADLCVQQFAQTTLAMTLEPDSVKETTGIAEGRPYQGPVKYEDVQDLLRK